MAKLKNIKWKHYINYLAVAAVTVLFGILSLAGALPSSTIYLLEKIAIAIMLAVSLSVVVGFLGELSLGHAGFMCVGAYLGGKRSCLLEPVFGNGFVTLLISILVGGIIAAMCGILIGLPALRLKGDYLAIVTLAFGEEAKWDRVPTKIEMNEILSVELNPTSSTMNPDRKEGK